ncbi:Myb-like DNA-binding domain-containing protein 8 [Elsinoe australis]|uniref:Myb-like DNA-binding domain-containing protein 8 n=1 Tax=Elsinoe australis TaxID=40998 RepID=A0A4U7AV19_9PEZI|nr:Myb-like DNA-binding domain-containing protein 8 [Elsinoe australis]
MSHLPPMQTAPDARMQAPVGGPNMNYAQNKRLASGNHPAESPAKKKQSKWSAEEDAAIIELRGNGMKWEDISRNLPGRSAISCRLRFQNYLERRSEWDEEKKNKLARLYERFKKDMWEKIAKEMALPWRAAEAMHWQIGEVEMASRANVPVFHLAGYSPSQPSQGYQGASATPLSGSERRSDGSASPHSNSDTYPPMQGLSDPSREGSVRLEGHRLNAENHNHINRRNSELSSLAEHEDVQQRRSPRPPTAHDSVASSLAGDRDGTTVPKQYLSPFAKIDESSSIANNHDGRRSPNRGV